MPEGIHDALLIYNPTSGGRRHRRFAEIEQAARVLKDSGITTEIAPTTAIGSAQEIARQAVQQRRGMVIACGGDGTINEIINGLAGSAVPMALLPAGTANILAKELRHSLGYSRCRAPDSRRIDSPRCSGPRDFPERFAFRGIAP